MPSLAQPASSTSGWTLCLSPYKNKQNLRGEHLSSKAATSQPSPRPPTSVMRAAVRTQPAASSQSQCLAFSSDSTTVGRFKVVMDPGRKGGGEVVAAETSLAQSCCRVRVGKQGSRALGSSTTRREGRRKWQESAIPRLNCGLIVMLTVAVGGK